jgi:L-ribulose-5-phosphate 3-epimerase UlaE
MSYFEDIRSTFEKQGLRIKSYSVRFGSSQAEIDRLFLMAKALGADSLVTRLPASLTSMTAAAADKHRMIVSLQVSDMNELKKQLAASQYFRMNPDIGDLTKAKIDALQFVETNYPSISAFDLKDALPGGPSVPFGEGAAHMKEVLQFLKQKQAPITAYVDCDYAGTGRSAEEVEKCASYARTIIG